MRIRQEIQASAVLDAPCSRYARVRIVRWGSVLGTGSVAELALNACHGLHIEPSGRIALSVSTSKGDPLAIDASVRGDHARWPGSWPGDLEPVLARALGLRHFYPAPVAAACSTGLYGLLAVADAMESGRANQGLVVASEGTLPAWLHAGFARLGVLASTEADTAVAGPGHQSLGFHPASGAGALQLMRLDGSDPTDQRHWYVEAGVRLGDAGHETHFLHTDTLISALHSLWQVTGRPDLIVPHATGTIAGDRYELACLEAGPWRDVPRWCAKPTIGHCLGASGLVEMALALEQAESTKPSVDRMWKISLGFGGHLVVVALCRK